eukprot:m.76787 g.76787  ORF g.76787 m.76787 type:complete len:507 (-) comp24934_c0_seq1:475-1995(-)
MVSMKRMLQMLQHLRKPDHLAYGVSAMIIAVVHNMFLIYHIELFTYCFKIDESSFQMGSVLFLIWNAVNDFVLGWISDSVMLKHTSKVSCSASDDVQTITRRKRIKGLAVGGPAMALSLLLMVHRWSWIPCGLQYVIALCLYDTCLTWVDLSHNSLLAELSLEEDDRSTMSMMASVCSALGSSVVFVSFLFWDKNYLFPFQTFILVLAIVATVIFRLSADVLSKIMPRMPIRNGSPSKRLGFPADQEQDITMKHFLSQMLTNRNFLVFTLLSLVQTFHCHFNSNFFPLFLGVLLRGSVSEYGQSMVLGLSFFIPHVNNIYFTSLVDTVGTYSVIWRLLQMKLVIAVVMLIGGSSNWILVVFVVASNRVFTEGTCKLLNLVLSDLIDEDQMLHQRKGSVAALIFGTNNLITKPGQSLAPLFGTYYLASQSKGFLFSSETVLESLENPTELIEKGQDDDGNVKEALFVLLTYVPIVCALIQLALWSQYTLHGSRLRDVRKAMQRMSRP